VSQNKQHAWSSGNFHGHPVLSRLPILLAKMVNAGKEGVLTKDGVKLCEDSPEAAATAYRLSRNLEKRRVNAARR
jgi:hypothetical protein